MRHMGTLVIIDSQYKHTQCTVHGDEGVHWQTQRVTERVSYLVALLHGTRSVSAGGDAFTDGGYVGRVTDTKGEGGRE